MKAGAGLVLAALVPVSAAGPAPAPGAIPCAPPKLLVGAKAAPDGYALLK